MKKLITLLSAFTLIALSSAKLNAQGCIANFSWTAGQNGVVTFTSTSAPSSSLTYYSWNFGNNTTYTAMGIMGQTATSTYTANGTYVVNLFFISTAPSCSNAVSYTINVTNVSGCALNANFGYSQTSNGTVNFNNTTTGAGPGVSYSWDFGDNTSPSAVTSPVHTYSANGTYIATLTAVNSPTCTSTKTLAINVNTYCNLNASFSVTMGNNGLVNFMSTSTGTAAGYIYIWNFGDGSNPLVAGPNTSHTYTNGTYNASLYVMSSSVSINCVDTAFATISVTNATCNIVAGFNYTSSNGTFTFNNTSTGTNAGTTYTWTFGNGFFSNAANPSAVNYPSSGVYFVSLTASNGTGCSASTGQSVSVSGIPCVANANFSLMPSGTPQFWIAIPSFPWNIATAQWSWGDNSAPSYSLYTAHQYSASGNYNICLTVTATCGATATACSTYSVYRGTAASAIINVNVNQPALKDLEFVSTVGLNELTATIRSALYPNPSTGLFGVSATGLTAEMATITVYNHLGQLLLSDVRPTNNGSLVAEVSLNNAQKGIYFVKIESGNKTVVNKLIIE